MRTFHVSAFHRFSFHALRNSYHRSSSSAPHLLSDCSYSIMPGSNISKWLKRPFGKSKRTDRNDDVADGSTQSNALHAQLQIPQQVTQVASSTNAVDILSINQNRNAVLVSPSMPENSQAAAGDNYGGATQYRTGLNMLWESSNDEPIVEYVSPEFLSIFMSN